MRERNRRANLIFAIHDASNIHIPFKSYRRGRSFRSIFKKSLSVVPLLNPYKILSDPNSIFLKSNNSFQYITNKNFNRPNKIYQKFKKIK